MVARKRRIDGRDLGKVAVGLLEHGVSVLKAQKLIAYILWFEYLNVHKKEIATYCDKLNHQNHNP